jgi:Protein of unknown function (DUF4235)
VGEGTPAAPVSRARALPEDRRSPRARSSGAPDGLADRIAAVEAARERLGQDLEQLDVEVRAQMSQTAEKTAWKVLGTGLAILSGIVVRKLLMAVWRRTTKHDPPTNPGAPDTTWVEALGWALASGAAVGVSRMVAARGATAGWQRVTGTLPPGVSDVAR